MPLPLSSAASTKDQSSRKQLDDLDALLQRMLELPVSPVEEEKLDYSYSGDGESAIPSYEYNPAEEAPSNESSLFPVNNVSAMGEQAPTPDQPEPSTVWVGFASYSASEVEASREAFGAFQSQEAKTEDSPPENVERFLPEDSYQAEHSKMTAALLWIDDLFQSAVSGWGSFGRWLRGPGGRIFLGGLGIMLMAVAVTLLMVSRFGWTW
jgi:hypothetical protein